jgi:nucleoside transporter
MRRRLAVMMFLQYAILGVWGVTLPTFLMAPPHEGGLSLSGQQVGLLFGTFAIAAMGTPFVIGLLADRFFASQRLLAVLHLLGAVFLTILFVYVVLSRSQMRQGLIDQWERQNPHSRDVRNYFDHMNDKERFDVAAMVHQVRCQLTRLIGGTIVSASTGSTVLEDDLYRIFIVPNAVPEVRVLLQSTEYRSQVAYHFRRLFLLFLGAAACYMPTLTLCNSISFRNLLHPMRQYGHVRVFGTLGWIAAGMFAGLLLPPVSPGPLIYGAAAALVLGIYASSLPNTPPAHEGKTLGELFGVPAMKMFARRSFRAFVITSFIITLVTAFHNTYLNRYLVDLGVQNAAAWQTTGQVTEIVCILALPRLRSRIGLKRTLFIGLAASVVRFALYATGNVPLLIAVGIPLQGVCFGFYFVAAMLFIDKHAPRDLRASAQGLLAICTSGVGAFTGNWVAGLAVDGYRSPTGVAWQAVWALPAIGSLAAALYFAWQFREPVPVMEPALVAV